MQQISSDYGTNWLKALGFVSGFSFMVYMLVIFVLCITPCADISKDNGVGKVFAGYFEILNVADWRLSPLGVDDNPWVYVIVFVGRIFIFFGIYQLVQSFRKYSRNNL